MFPCVSFQVNSLRLKPWTVVSVSVQGSRSVGRRRLRSIDPQTDEPEGKPGAVWQYVHPTPSLLSGVFIQVLSSHCFLSHRRQSDDPTHQLRRSLVSPTTSFSSPFSILPWNPLSTRCPHSQHVDGLPGGGCGSYRVEGSDGDVGYREAAQTGENTSVPADHRVLIQWGVRVCF